MLRRRERSWLRADLRRLRGRDQVRGLRGLASLGPFLGAPAGSPGKVKCTGGTGSGAWHPLTPSWVPFRGVPAPQIMEDVEVIQHVPTALEQIVVCQCHRSCWYVEVEQLVRCTFYRCSSWTRLFVPVVVQ